MFFHWSLDSLQPTGLYFGSWENEIILSFPIFALHFLWFTSVSQNERLYTSTEPEEQKCYVGVPRMEVFFFLWCRTPQIYNLTAAHLHLALQAKPPTGQMRSMENEMLLKLQTSSLIQTVRFSSHLRRLYLWLLLHAAMHFCLL